MTLRESHGSSVHQRTAGCYHEGTLFPVPKRSNAVDGETAGSPPEDRRKCANKWTLKRLVTAVTCKRRHVVSLHRTPEGTSLIINVPLAGRDTE